MVHEWCALSLRDAGVELIDCEHRTPQPADRGLPYVTIPQLRAGRIDFAEARRISPEDFESWTRKAKPALHDVVLSRRCNPGETAVVGPDAEFALGQNLVLLRANGTKVFPPFLRWLTRGPEWWGQVGEFLNVGAVFDSLKCADVPRFTLRIPPLAEQRAIAAILGAFDDKIEVNRRVCETLEAMARALFKSWFIDFDPVRAKAAGHDPGLPRAVANLFPGDLTSDGEREVPEGWAWRELAEVVGLGPSLPLPRGTMAPYLDMAALPTRGAVAAAPRPRAYTSGSRFQNGDTLVARITPCLENGKAALVQELAPGQTGWGSTEFMVMRPVPPVPMAYPYLLARDAAFRRAAVKSMVGTSGRQRVQPDVLARYLVAFPSPRIWRAFGAATSPMLSAISAKAAESRTLAALRDALLPKLISGEIRVKQAEKVARAAL